MVEGVDADGDRCELVATSLGNNVAPLIRFRSDDIVRALSSFRPLTQVKPDEIEDLRRWARDALAIDANRGTQLGAAAVRSLEL